MRPRPSSSPVDQAAASSGGRFLASVEVALVGLVALLAVPYAVRGVGYFREDWVSLAEADAGAWSAIGDVGALTRPIATPVYALLFGLLGGHPLIAYGLLIAGVAVAVVLLHRVTLRLLDLHLGPARAHRWRAASIAATYVLLPTHAALTHWISVAHLVAALAVVLGGVLALHPPAGGTHRTWLAAACFGMAGLAYEGVLPVAALGLLSRLHLDGRSAWRRIAAPALVCGCVVAYQFVVGFMVAEKAPLMFAELGQAISGNIGWGITTTRAWPLLQIVVLVAAVVGLARVLRSPSTSGVGERIVAIGVLVFVAGLAPFVPFGADIDFVGLGDRANVVAAIGVACVLVGTADALSRAVGSRSPHSVALGGLVLLVAVVSAPTRWEQDAEWARVAEWQVRVLDDASARVADGDGVVVLGPAPVSTPAVEGMNNAWDSTAALRWWTGAPDVEVVFVYGGADDPPIDVDTTP